MFEENENLALEAENTVEQPVEDVVEDTTEEVDETEQVEDTNEVVGQEEPVEVQEKLYTEEELNQRVDDLLAKKLARKENKIRKEYEKKYGRVETVLNAGLGTSSIEEATEQLTDYYKEQGVQIPEKVSYTDRDAEILANAEADEIISLGYDEIKEEVERLAEIGVDNMSKRDKTLFSKLAKERQRIEDERDLFSIGVGKSAIEDKEFIEFADKLNPKLSAKEKYEMYLSMKPKKETKKMGSMKNTNPNQNKDFYTSEEIDKLTDDQLDDDKIWDIVRKSMTKGKE